MASVVYVDCDNTMGLPGCDMDDGMALLYLLGAQDVEIRAVCTSFGNSTIDRVHVNTERMFQELSLEERIPLKKGAASPQARRSEASQFLVEDILRRQERVRLLVTGSPTNIWAACHENTKILRYIDEVVFMGGITEPLVIGGKVMPELNFSSDPQAMFELLNLRVKKTIITSQFCLDAFFDAEKMRVVSENQQYPALAYMQAPLRLWYDFISEQYGVPGFHVWDLVAAVYLTHPELFARREVGITSTLGDLGTGLLRIDTSLAHYTLNVPTHIQDIEQFWDIVFAAWQNADLRS